MQYERNEDKNYRQSRFNVGYRNDSEEAEQQAMEDKEMGLAKPAD